MGRTFKITEQQYRSLMQEEDDKNKVEIPTDGNSKPGDPIEKQFTDTMHRVEQSGINPNNVKIVTTPENSSRIITKKELVENRLKALKETSKLYTLKDFLKK